MGKQVFINLPVRDVARAKAFHEALGHSINPKFSNDEAVCVVVSESIYFMLLKTAFFQGFTDKGICDTSTHIEALFAMPEDTRAGVDEKMSRAIAAGGREAGSARDMGFMYQRTFTDPDGHTFEVFYMDESQFPGA